MHILIFAGTVLILLAIYFLPTMVASSRGHINTTAIFVADLLLGWTVLGWAIALIWSFTNSPASVAGSPPEARKSGLASFVKFLLAVFILVIIFMFIVGKHQPVGKNDVVKTPPVHMGVPAPADDVIGK